MAAEIDAGAAAGRSWNVKTFTIGGERIASGHGGGEFFRGVEFSGRHLEILQRSKIPVNQHFRLLPVDVLDPAHRIAQLSQKAVLNPAARMGHGIRNPVEGHHRILGHKKPGISRFECKLDFFLEQKPRIGDTIAHLNEIFEGEVGDGVGVAANKMIKATAATMGLTRRR